MNTEAAKMPAMPVELQPLVGLVRKYLTKDLLNEEWYEASEERERTGEVVSPTFGHCASAAGAFWELAGGSKAGWRFRRLPKRIWDEGPHYFVEHLPSKQVVDPTADQFSVEIPYKKAEGGAPPTSGASITKSARTLAERVLSDANAEDAIQQAQQWASEQTPLAEFAESTAATIIRADVVYDEFPSHTVIRNLPPTTHKSILTFLGSQKIDPLDIWDDAISVSYTDSPGVLQFLEGLGVNVTRHQTMHAEVVPVVHDGPVTAKAGDGPQDQREISKMIQKFLKDIKARDIRVRRMGHVTFTWLHPMEIEPGDTHSDLRWEIRQAGPQILMGVFDIKPFYRVVTGPFTVEKFKQTRKEILKEMDADA